MRVQANGALTVLISLLLIAGQTVQAQTLPRDIAIVVLEGDGVENNAADRAGHQIAVEVRDDQQKPVKDAAVSFTLPTEGATGEFRNGAKNLTVMSDEQGRAVVPTFRLNGMPGKIPIHVNASFHGLTARAVVTQTAVLPPGATYKPSHGHAALIIVLAVVAAGAGAGAYFATHKSGNSTVSNSTGTTVTPIGITPGQGTIVGGH